VERVEEVLEGRAHNNLQKEAWRKPEDRGQMTLTKKCNLYPRKVRPSLAGREEREERQNTENLFRLPKKLLPNIKFQLPNQV
jgi:hypothetical protein